MQLRGTNIILSASDLSAFLNCPHLTTLELLLLQKKIPPPEVYVDPTLMALIKKGEDFEENYINKLAAEGKSIVKISRDNKKTASEETFRAMQAGVEVIYQARLEQGRWNGWADFLFKVDKPSALGNWSYEIEDTKFARHTKAGAILQIALYSQLLATMQGTQPERMHIRTPAGTTQYRVDDYSGYLRWMQQKLLHTISDNNSDTYPEPVPHCDICRWWITCNKQRRQDDHLSFIAGMGRTQMREVRRWGIDTLKGMAQLTLPLNRKPLRGNVDTYTRLREQARVQLQTRESNKHVFELLELRPDLGLFALPEPSTGDMFFDFEGDPFVGTTGREYLFGWIHQNQYHSLWAFTEAQEKHAFDSFIDQVMKIREQYPAMHIYHYSPYEPAAIKRLMGKYASREHEVDTLLRSGVFVDLHSITRHALRAGIESYSLKELEKLHEFERAFELRTVGRHKAVLETMLENDLIAEASEETLSTVLGYNKEDCLSTVSLHTWLEGLRKKQIDAGHDIPRPVHIQREASEDLRDYQLRVKPIFDALTAGVPVEPNERTAHQQAHWLLAHMLEWYHREKKSFWWNYFRLISLPDEELLDERDAIAGLQFNGQIEQVSRSEVHYYTFPEQDADMREGVRVDFRGERIGSLYSVDWHRRVLGIKKKKDCRHIHPTHIISPDYIDDAVKREAVCRVAEAVVRHGMTEEGPYKTAYDLLMRTPPAPLTDSAALTDAQEKAIAWGMQLNNEVLPVQGPPGTGKSFTAARMILALVRAGKRVGITALGHKVITALLQKVNDLANRNGQTVTMIQKVRELTGDKPDNWDETTENEDVEQAIADGVHVAAGTAFMWARQEFEQAVDVLFVDEAGQLALIDTVALAHAGRNLVLLGDPQQLQQPQQGHHPEGTEVSALEHVLHGAPTITPDKGVLLDRTWRLHPTICAYTSALFYEGKLQSMPANANQRLDGRTKYHQPGIYLELMTHSGNKNDSPEEVVRVRAIIEELVNGDVYFVDVDNKRERLTRAWIKVIAPYNAQVNALVEALPEIEIGTVDKFQGQEAPVVIFSMATSSPEDAPRGMEFLYSLNRLNVAVSRARAVFILVVSETLLQPGCRTPEQMRLANALCSLVEQARRVN